MRSLVVVKVVTLGERLVADVALKGPLAAVGALMCV